MKEFFSGDAGAAFKILLGASIFILSCFYGWRVIQSGSNAVDLKVIENNKLCIEHGGIPIKLGGDSNQSCVWSKVGLN